MVCWLTGYKPNLPKEQKQLVRATVDEMKYKTMNEQLKKAFTTHYF